MSQTGQIAVSYPGDDLTLFFDTSSLPDAIDEVNSKPKGAQITLYAGNYFSDSGYIDNLQDERWMIFLPGAKVDYNAFDSSKVPQISDLDQLSYLDDILAPLDIFFDPDPSLGEGQIAYYDAEDDKLRYTDLLLVDTDQQKIDIHDLDVEKDITGPDDESIINKIDVLETLLPSAPGLRQASVNNLGKTGKLGFGESNPINGVENAPNTDFKELYDHTGNKNGIYGVNDDTIHGVLNEDVNMTENHDENVFGRAREGTLRLIINGSEFSKARLDLSPERNLSKGTGDTYLKAGKAKPLTYADGSEFSDEYQRTGTWSVSTSLMRSGYNKIVVKHYDNNDSLISETNLVELVFDDQSDSITFNNFGFTSISPSVGKKYLSGIAYHNFVNSRIEGTIDNVYKYTYEDNSNALKSSTSGNFVSFSKKIPDPSSDHESTIKVKKDITSDKQIFNGGFEAEISVEDPAENTQKSNLFSKYTLLVDDYPNNNTALDNHFDSEERRIKSDITTFTGDFNSDLNGNWDSTKDISDSGDPGYNDGLQVDIEPDESGHRLVYPDFDYSTMGQNTPQFNSNNNRNYSGTNTTGQRSYFGLFTNPNNSKNNFTLTIYGSGKLIKDDESFLDFDEFKMAFRLPSETGWLDVAKPFASSYGNVNDGTAYGDAVDGGRSSNLSDFNISDSGKDIGITSGIKPTAESYDKVYYRIVVPQDWSGYIKRIDIDW